jgi:hypothetical protein
MGEVSEVVLSLDFRRDTPPEVLAAFSALEQPLREGATWGPAPPLPEPVREPDEWWEPDWREDGGDPDPYEHEPWRHDWARWLSGSMSVGTVPSATLDWMPPGQWRLTCRCSFKSWAEAIFEFLEWLGRFIDAPLNPNYPHETLVGYIFDEGMPRPYLLWARNGVLRMEDLNEPHAAASD